MADHVYHLVIEPDGSVQPRPDVNGGPGPNRTTEKDLSWKAGETVRFVCDPAFDLRVTFMKKTDFTPPGGGEVEETPLGVDVVKVEDSNDHTAERQEPDPPGQRFFRFRCTLIEKRTGKRFGWKSPADDQRSGSGDGNVHNR